MRGFVVSAGTADIVAERAHVIVPLAELRSALQREVVVPLLGEAGLDRARSRLGAEAMQGEPRGAAHVAYVVSRKRVGAGLT